MKNWLERNRHVIAGHVVTKKNGQERMPVLSISEFANRKGEDFVILLGLDEKYHEEVLRGLRHAGFSENVFPRNGVGFRELLALVRYENDLCGTFDPWVCNRNGYMNWIMDADRRHRQ